MADDSGTIGPISYLIVEFPGNKMTGEGLPILVDLVDRGVIRILDLTFVAKGQDGSLAVLQIEDLDLDGTVDLAVFAGASSGLVSEVGSRRSRPGDPTGLLGRDPHLREQVGDGLRPSPASRQGRADRRRVHPTRRPRGRP